MKCLTHDKIEAWVLGVPIDREAINEHIADCDRCGEIARAFSNLYIEAEAMDEGAIQNRIRVSLGETLSTITLTPINFLPQSTCFRLAAKTAMNGQNTFIQGFINEQEDIVGRLILEEETGEIRLFLITHRDQLQGSILVQIEGDERTWLCDESGSVSLGVIDPSLLIGRVIHLNIAQAIFEMQPLRQYEQTPIAEHTWNILNPDVSQVSIQIEDVSGKRMYKILLDSALVKTKARQVYVSIHQGRTMEHRPVINHTAVFEHIDEEKHLHITVF